jgi:hypoxanthine-guanine phosphoribosyltransferase
VTDCDTANTRFGRILLTKKRLSANIANLAEQIQTTYAHNDEVIVLVLLNGAKRFVDELFGHINDEKFRLRYLSAGSYNGAESGGGVNQTESKVQRDFQ